MILAQRAIERAIFEVYVRNRIGNEDIRKWTEVTDSPKQLLSLSGSGRDILLIEQMADEAREILSGEGVPEYAALADHSHGGQMTWWGLRESIGCEQRKTGHSDYSLWKAYV